MPVVDTNPDSQAVSVLSPDRDMPPDSADILFVFMVCAQTVNHIDGVTVQVEATAINGIPEFLLSYTEASPSPRFTGVLASWEPKQRRLYVRDVVIDPERNPRANTTIWQSRRYLLLLRQAQIKWGDRALMHGTTDLV